MPFQDYGGFGSAYFEGRHHDNPHPAGYSEYRRNLLPFSYYAEKLTTELQARGVDPTGEKVLIVGCAYGYTVEYLIDQWDVDAYGMDVSSWAVEQAATETAYGDRIYQGDVTNASDLKAVRQSTPGGKFAVVFSECVLECLTDTEAQTATTNMREEAQQAAGHRVWLADRLADGEYNEHTLSEWQSLCDPDGQDYWFSEASFQPRGGV